MVYYSYLHTTWLCTVYYSVYHYTTQSVYYSCVLVSILVFDLQRREKLKGEVETESIDSEAMKKLSYVLYPLVLAGAVYQLLFSSYKR